MPGKKPCEVCGRFIGNSELIRVYSMDPEIRIGILGNKYKSYKRDGNLCSACWHQIKINKLKGGKSK